MLAEQCFVEISETNLIESGTYGSVYKYSCNGKEYAIKKICLKNQFNTFLRESEMGLKTMGNKYTVPVYKSFSVNNNGYLLLENCKSDLFSELRHETVVSEKAASRLFKKICLAVAELHKQNIAHLDIKLENILITHSGQIKLCDFGSAMNFETGKKYHPVDKIGTPIYCAPEIIKKKPFVPTLGDSWSLGVVLHAILFQCFPVRSIKGPFDCYLNYSIDHISSSSISENGKLLLLTLLSLDPSSRLSVEEILQHPWINKFNTKSSGTLKSLKTMVKKASKIVFE